MLIVMKSDAAAEQVEGVVRVIKDMGLCAHALPGAERTAVCITGNNSALDSSRFDHLPGVAEVIRVTKPYKLISLEMRREKTVVSVGGESIGGGELAIIAGPCAVESREQTFAIAAAVSRAGARFLRGGAYKPRSSPYSFQGLGEEGLRILAEARERFGLKIVTEALDEHGVDLVERYADVIQLGARNMQNSSLLRRAGRSHLPVLLKRGLSATLEEWLLSAEYIMLEGNYNVILCERGIRTFTDHTRNTLDVAAVPAVRRLSHLPVIIDPSHAAGHNYLVLPLAKAGVAVGADGLIVEVHHNPREALCDGAQALTVEQFGKMVAEVQAMYGALEPLAAA
jgi:3-deoxy-7-phosphoheptulonate synthase